MAEDRLTLRNGPGGEPVQGNFWLEVGGRATFEKLVRAFYAGIESDPVLLPMYPESDLEGAIQRLTGFLEQYWGGPGTYSEERGHPRLRMRHVDFKVNPDARDRWLLHMRAALDRLRDRVRSLVERVHHRVGGALEVAPERRVVQR